jgi:hypothetical protein
MSDEPIEFGDADPEDAWDRGDSIGLKLDNLARRLRLVLDRFDGDDRDDIRRRLALILKHVDELRQLT